MISSFSGPSIPPIIPKQSNANGENRSKFSQPKDDGFDIDALVKRIDAKIAELEEQEKLEQLSKVQGEKQTINEPVAESENSTISQPKIELKEEENKVINGVTDDQFFDDFFNDEDE